MTLQKHFLTIVFFSSLFLISCSKQPPTEVWLMNEDCDIASGHCVNENNGIKVTLSISPNQPIPIAKRLDIKVEIEGMDAQKVQFDIAGINMYMGYNRVNLTKSDNGIYQGKSMLAFCTVNTMEWLLSVMILSEDGSIKQVPFKLITYNSAIK